jgi:hypothetical protein
MTETWLPDTSLANDDEGYHLDVNEVAELLGVTRTRVSQLTSSGQLSFERRRVGARNRLFYRRSEVLAHQRTFYGRHIPGSSSPSAKVTHEQTETGENIFSPETLSDSLGGRVGASSSFAHRTLSVWPEHLLLEISKLLAREQSNADLLLKIRELSLQIQAQVLAPERKPLPSALELEEREQTLQQFKILARELEGLRSQFHSQEQQMSGLRWEIAELKKLLLQLKHEQLKIALPRATPALTSVEPVRSFTVEAQPSLCLPRMENTMHRKRLHPRVGRTTVRKQICKR